MMELISSYLPFMANAAPMPIPDPLGYPVPPWILQALSYLTMTFHLLAMNFTIGGSILILWYYIRKNENMKDIASFFGSAMPLGVSYIITLGIPPLLFVQVLYGQMFYSSSVLMGAFWIQVIPAAILIYAGFYYHKFNRGGHPHWQGPVIALGLFLMIYIGFIYTNNLTLSFMPEKWIGLYSDHPGGGILSHREASVHPRLLLFLSGAFAVAGIALLWRGCYLLKWGMEKAGQYSQKLGRNFFFVSPLLWGLSVAGLYMTRGSDLSLMWDKSDATGILFGIGLASGIVLILSVILAVGKKSIFFPMLASTGMTGVMASQVVFRDLVRLKELKPYFTLESMPVNPQWGMFLIFVVSLVIGVALLTVLAVKVFPGMARQSRERLEKAML